MLTRSKTTRSLALDVLLHKDIYVTIHPMLDMDALGALRATCSTARIAVDKSTKRLIVGLPRNNEDFGPLAISPFIDPDCVYVRGHSMARDGSDDLQKADRKNLAHRMKSWSKLQALEISKIPVRTICKLLKSTPFLTRLGISGRNDNDSNDAFKHLFKLKLPHLKSWQLHAEPSVYEGELDDYSCIYLSHISPLFIPAMIKYQHNWPAMEELVIRCLADGNAAYLPQLAKINWKLKVLRIEYASCAKKFYPDFPACSWTSSLTSLSLHPDDDEDDQPEDEVVGIGDKGLKCFKNANWDNLKELNLSVQVRGKGFEVLASTQLPSLTKLELKGEFSSAVSSPSDLCGSGWISQLKWLKFQLGGAVPAAGNAGERSRHWLVQFFTELRANNGIDTFSFESPSGYTWIQAIFRDILSAGKGKMPCLEEVESSSLSSSQKKKLVAVFRGDEDYDDSDDSYELLELVELEELDDSEDSDAE